MWDIKIPCMTLPTQDLHNKYIQLPKILSHVCEQSYTGTPFRPALLEKSCTNKSRCRAPSASTCTMRTSPTTRKSGRATSMKVSSQGHQVRFPARGLSSCWLSGFGFRAGHLCLSLSREVVPKCAECPTTSTGQQSHLNPKP